MQIKQSICYPYNPFNLCNLSENAQYYSLAKLKYV